MGGAPGSLSITGIQMEEGVNGKYDFDAEKGKRIDILNSNFADGSGFFRLDLVAAAPYLNRYEESALTDNRLDGTNSAEIARIDYGTLNQADRLQLMEEQYESQVSNGAVPFNQWITTATDQDKIDFGLDKDSLIKLMEQRLNSGFDARAREIQDPLFDNIRTTEGLTNLREKIQLNVSDEQFAGNIIAADYLKGEDLEDLDIDSNGNILIPIQVAYVGANGVSRKEVITPENPAYQQFIQAVGERGIDEMFARSGYVINNATGGTGGTAGVGSTASAQDIELADLEQQRVDILEGGRGVEGGPLDVGDGLNSIIARAEKLKQQSIDTSPEEVGIIEGLAGTSSKSEVEARPITDFMSVTDLAMYNNRKRQLEEVESEIERIKNQSPDAASTETADAESRPLQTEPGGVYTSAQLEQNLESWEKELLAGTRPGQTVKSGVAVKAKNFGNLRPNTANPYRSGVYEVSPAEYDDDGNLVKPANQYQNFATYDDGLKGLIWDIKSKQHLDGLSSSAVADGAEIIEVMKKYAPAADRNNPEGYTNHIVNFVNERLGLTGEEAFTSKSPASELPTELLVEAIISKEDISLYKDMKERGYFEEDKISGIAEDINSQTARERRREISRA